VLTTDRYRHFRYQTADLDGLNPPYQLIATTHAPKFLLAIRFSFTAASKQKSVHFALRNAMMSTRSLDAANFFLVNPLLDRGVANPQLQSGVRKL